MFADEIYENADSDLLREAPDRISFPHFYVV